MNTLSFAVISQIVAELHSFQTANIPNTSAETRLIPAGKKRKHTVASTGGIQVSLRNIYRCFKAEPFIL